MNEKPVVISLGGSMLFAQDGAINVEYIKDFCATIAKIKKQGYKVAIIVGGGRTAREYANAMRELVQSEFYADRLGIDATRLNAKLVIATLGENAFPKVVKDIDDSFHAFREGLVPVGAGILEGMTTDAIAALLAERLQACRLINVSSVDAIYDSDPRANPNAKKFTTMTHDQLTALAERDDSRRAKTNFVFDLVATKIAARSDIPLHFVSGKNLDEVERAIKGEKHGGTIVKN